MTAPTCNRAAVIAEAKRLYDEGLTTIQVAAELDISQSTAHRMIRDLSSSGRQRLDHRGHGTMRCTRCGRPNITRPLCYVCIDQDKAQAKEPLCRMVLSPWQRLPDGTQMRTLTGV